MKKILTTFLLLVSFATVFAQYRDSVELKGTNNTYKRYTSPKCYFLYNKANTFMFIDPNYPEGEYTLPHITIGNASTLYGLIKKYITPILKNTDLHFDSINYSTFRINFFSDAVGNIKEISLYYSQQFPIPIATIEAFEAELLKSDVKLVFNTKVRMLRDARQVVKTWGIHYEDIIKL